MQNLTSASEPTVRRTLDISRTRRGKLLELARPVIGAAGHVLHVEGAANLHRDVARRAQAFGNPLDKAAKYTPPGDRVGPRMWQLNVEQRR